MLREIEQAKPNPWRTAAGAVDTGVHGPSYPAGVPRDDDTEPACRGFAGHAARGQKDEVESLASLCIGRKH